MAKGDANTPPPQPQQQQQQQQPATTGSAGASPITGSYGPAMANMATSGAGGANLPPMFNVPGGSPTFNERGPSSPMIGGGMQVGGGMPSGMPTYKFGGQQPTSLMQQPGGGNMGGGFQNIMGRIATNMGSINPSQGDLGFFSNPNGALQRGGQAMGSMGSMGGMMRRPGFRMGGNAKGNMGGGQGTINNNQQQ